MLPILHNRNWSLHIPYFLPKVILKDLVSRPEPNADLVFPKLCFKENGHMVKMVAIIIIIGQGAASPVCGGAEQNLRGTQESRGDPGEP